MARVINVITNVDVNKLLFLLYFEILRVRITELYRIAGNELMSWNDLCGEPFDLA